MQELLTAFRMWSCVKITCSPQQTVKVQKILPSCGGRQSRCSEMRKICQGNQICFNLWRGKRTASNFHGKQLGIYAATALASVPLCPVFVFTLAAFQPCETPSLEWVIRNTCQAVQRVCSIFKIKDRFLKNGKPKLRKMYFIIMELQQPRKTKHEWLNDEKYRKEIQETTILELQLWNVLTTAQECVSTLKRSPRADSAFWMRMRLKKQLPSRWKGKLELQERKDLRGAQPWPALSFSSFQSWIPLWSRLLLNHLSCHFCV